MSSTVELSKYLDLDVEDNDNHLLNYVLHHQRPQLSKSIDSNLVFDIAGHTLLFERSEFSLVTGFACEKLVFPEYMDDCIPPFLRSVFLDKAKNLENKASLGKAAQGKAAKGKGVKVKAGKGKDVKRKAAQGKAAQPTDIGDTHSVTILDLISSIWDDEKWKKLSVEDSIQTLTPTSKKNPSKLPTYSIYGFAWAFKVWILESFPNSYHWWSKESEVIPRCLAWTRRKGFEKQNYPELFGPDSNLITQIRPDLKERYENWCRKTYDYVACKKRYEQVDDQNAFTRDDEPKAEQDGSGASDRVSVGAKFEETKSTREVALEEELDLWKSRYVELESYYKILEASVEIARKNSPGLSFPTSNAKDMSVCDDIDEADVAADNNAKATSVHDDATSVHDDVGVPDAVAYDNAKATSVCDDINEADAAADDNAKATSVHDDVGVPDAASDDNAKATSVCDDINEADAATDDNAKAMSVHDNVGVPDAAANDNAKDVHEIINHTDPPIHGFQIMLWGGLEKKGYGLDKAKANREVVSAADNGEVVKETQQPDSHENEERDSVIRLPAYYWKLLKGNPHCALGRGSQSIGLVDVAFQAKACRLGYFLSILLQSSNTVWPRGLDIQGYHLPRGVGRHRNV
uniref:Phospholipase-like protein n=1 Tax=Tanacetum cinerariifolium TaxID=118510 RepID=A0A699H904_TANCI|nr:hypothetical protein [Tanacetum cinerariifolium]